MSSLQKLSPENFGAPLGQFMATKFTGYEPIIYGLRPSEFGLIVAKTNVGKTSLGLNLLISVSCGREFRPLVNAGKPRRALFTAFEDSEASLQTDFAVMLAQLTPEERDLVNKNLHVLVDVRVGEESLCLNNPTHMALILNYCKLNKIDLMMIDTLSAGFILIDENDNAEMTKVVTDPLQKLLKDCGAAGIVVHHIGKGRESDSSQIYAARGATALPAAARAIYSLKKDKRDDDCVILSCVKIKGRRFDDTILRLDPLTRWFTPVVEPGVVVAQTRRTNYQRVLDLITCELARKEINALALAVGISSASVGRELRNGLDRKELTSTRRGRYARPSQHDTATTDI